MQKAPSKGSLRVSRNQVGAGHDPPADSVKQNPSPSGDNRIIFLRIIRKTTFFGGRVMTLPYRLPGNRFLDSQNQDFFCWV